MAVYDSPVVTATPLPWVPGVLVKFANYSDVTDVEVKFSSSSSYSPTITPALAYEAPDEYTYRFDDLTPGLYYYSVRIETADGWGTATTGSVVLAYSVEPTRLSPNGSLLDRGQTVTFEWLPAVFSPAVYINQIQIRYRSKGGTWPGTPQVTASYPFGTIASSYTLAAANLSAGEYEWQVRTRDNASGLYGPWSDVATFAAEDKPVTQIDTPSAGTYTDSTIIPTWSAPGAPSYLHASSITVAVKDGSTVIGQYSGAPSGLSSWTSPYLEDGKSYSIVLSSVWERGGYSGTIAADDATVTISVSYNKPPEIDVQISDMSVGVAAAISFAVTPHAAGPGEEAATQASLYRSVDGGESWQLIASKPVVGGVVAGFTDWAPVTNGETAYRVDVFTALGKMRRVAPAATYVGSDRSNGWLTDPEGSGLSTVFKIPFNLNIEPAYSLNATQYHFAGKEYPDAVYGKSADYSVHVTGIIEGGTSVWMQLLKLVQSRRTLLWRDPAGHRLYGMVTGFTPGYVQGNPSYRTVDFTITRQNHPDDGGVHYVDPDARIQ